MATGTIRVPVLLHAEMAALGHSAKTSSADECRACEGRCCLDILVPVNGFDVARIARAYDLPAQTFVDAIDDDGEHAGVFRIGTRRCSLVLAKNRHDPRACAFLEPRDGMRRCTIHPMRPRVCAIFPMMLVDGAIAVRDTGACARSNWEEGALTHALWSGYIAQDARDAADYGRIVARWNASALADIDDGAVAFLAYVTNACSA